MRTSLPSRAPGRAHHRRRPRLGAVRPVPPRPLSGRPATSRWIGGAFFVLVFFGCDGDINGPGRFDVEVSAPFTFEMDAVAASGLTLEGVNGAVRIVGDASGTVARIEGRRRVRSGSRADAQDFLDRVSVEALDEGDTIAVRTRQPSQAGGRQVIVDYEVTVPARMAIRLASVNGELLVDGFQGTVTVAQVNGEISLTRLGGDVEAGLVNGGIVADLAPPPGGEIDLHVVNGTVGLDLPISVSAWLDARVVNGSVSVRGLTLTGGSSTTRSVSGRLGSGDGQIDLSATNGTITVRGR